MAKLTGPQERTVMETRSAAIHRKCRHRHADSPLLDLPIMQSVFSLASRKDAGDENAPRWIATVS
jgi:hypothetical protein